MTTEKQELLTDEDKRYFDQFGLLNEKKDEICENGILFLALFLRYGFKHYPYNLLPNEDLYFHTIKQEIADGKDLRQSPIDARSASFDNMIAYLYTIFFTTEERSKLKLIPRYLLYPPKLILFAYLKGRWYLYPLLIVTWVSMIVSCLNRIKIRPYPWTKLALKLKGLTKGETTQTYINGDWVSTKTAYYVGGDLSKVVYFTRESALDGKILNFLIIDLLKMRFKYDIVTKCVAFICHQIMVIRFGRNYGYKILTQFCNKPDAEHPIGKVLRVDGINPSYLD